MSLHAWQQSDMIRGRLIGRMCQALGFKPREEAVLQTLTQDVVKTNEIGDSAEQSKLFDGRISDNSVIKMV